MPDTFSLSKEKHYILVMANRNLPEEICVHHSLQPSKWLSGLIFPQPMTLADTFPKSHRNQEKYIVNAIKNKLVFETTFQSFKLKQNGNGLLLIHVVHEIEAMYSS